MTLYRYTGNHYTDETTSITLQEWIILRKTRCGYWIIPKGYENYPEVVQESRKKWIHETANNRFAYDTEEEAWKGFKRRNANHIAILEGQLERAVALRSRIEESKNQLQEI